jgi:hypothetical protein
MGRANPVGGFRHVAGPFAVAEEEALALARRHSLRVKH